MAIELASGARETCTVSGNDFSLTGATSGAIDFLAAITKTATVVDGSTVYAYAFESADPSTYEVMEMTYTSASNKLVRVSTSHGSNGASAVTFDTATSAVVIYRALGQYDLPNLSAVSMSAYLSGAVTLVANTPKELTTYTESWDTGSNFASGRFTAPHTAKYDVKATVLFNVGSDSDRIRLALYKNGASALTAFGAASGSSSQSLNLSTTVSLVAGDYISIYATNVDSGDSVSGGSASSDFVVSTHIVP